MVQQIKTIVLYIVTGLLGTFLNFLIIYRGAEYQQPHVFSFIFLILSSPIVCCVSFCLGLIHAINKNNTLKKTIDYFIKIFLIEFSFLAVTLLLDLKLIILTITLWIMYLFGNKINLFKDNKTLKQVIIKSLNLKDDKKLGE